MGGTRGQSEVVGVVLLLGFTLVVGGVAVALGTGTVSHLGDHASVQQAESALSQFDSAASDVALGSSKTKQVDLGSANGNVRVTDRGTLTVTATNLLSSNETKRTLGHVRLGAVVFTRGGETVAYQSGGVWRDGQIVSPPEMHYNKGTLTLPVISVNGSRSVHGNGGLVVKRSTATRSVFPTAKLGNPISAKRVNVTVQSPYCTGWAQYFRTRTAGTVTGCDASNRTTLTLTDPVPNTPVNSGIIATNGVPNKINKNSRADKYNSTNGSYSESQISDSTTSVSHAITYAAPNGVGVPTHIASLRQHHNNTTLPSGVQNGNGGTISAGSYYFNGLTVNSGKTLVLNTRNGSINIAVNGSMVVNGRIKVVGSHRVNLYTDTKHFRMRKGSAINVARDHADRFWLYVSPSSQKVMIGKNVKFTGVIYGSGGSTAPGPTIKIKKGSSVYGAVVGNLKLVDKGTAFHYDTALRDVPVNPTAATEHPPAISYLHVSVENITVSDAR